MKGLLILGLRKHLYGYLWLLFMANITVQVHVPQKPQKKRVVITFFILVAFKNGFVSMKGWRKRGLPVGCHYFLPKIDRVLM